MCDLCLAMRLVKDATEAVGCLRGYMQYRLRRIAVHTLFVKQVGATETDLRKALVPFFREQGLEIARRVREIEGKGFGKTIEDENAAALMKLVFDPKAWNAKLVDLVLPMLAVQMIEAARGLLFTELGIGDVVNRRSVPSNAKASTATEWLASHAEDAEELEELLEGRGLPVGIMTELPEGVRRNILSKLRETFKQPYWRDISVTTAGDAERVLKQGLVDGWSIRRMSDEMANSLGGDKYAKQRATLIARTEAGRALNGARKGTMDALKEDMPPEAADVLVPTWLSVLGDTTREEHAALDGVPADADGLWNLAGYSIPYPSHHSLPVEHSANCQCTITMEFGMQQEEARQLLDDYAARQEEM